MLRLDLISARGDILPLIDNPFFDIVNVDGMTRYNANISSTTIGGVDGDTINNIQGQPRGIVLDLAIKQSVNVEEAKRYIFKHIIPQKTAVLEWEQSERAVTISGKLEAAEMPRWTNEVIMQLTLYCEQPFWEDVDFVAQQISENINHHYFTESADDMLYFTDDGIVLGEYDVTRTRSFFNEGEVAVGLEITILALDTVTNPIIYNESGAYIGVGHGTGNKQLVMNNGDTVVITTHKGGKTVKHNGVDVLAKLKPNSTWLQLESGNNTFAIQSDDDNISNMYFSLEYKRRYI